MNEITKLYENAGVNKIFKYYECSYGTSSIQVCPIPLGDCIGVCDRKSIWEYPPFTAEKQIAILQLLTQQCDLTISHFTEWEFIHYDGQEPTQVTGKDFTETFAKLINDYWQSLTVEWKQQVKDILQ